MKKYDFPTLDPPYTLEGSLYQEFVIERLKGPLSKRKQILVGYIKSLYYRGRGVVLLRSNV